MGRESKSSDRKQKQWQSEQQTYIYIYIDVFVEYNEGIGVNYTCFKIPYSIIKY